MTLMIVLGQFGGFHVSSGHLCLGWVSFTCLPLDLELRMEEMVGRIKSLEYLLHCIKSAPQTDKTTRWAIEKVMEKRNELE